MIIKKIFPLLLLFIYLPMKAPDPIARPSDRMLPPAGGFDPKMSEEQLMNQLMEEINAALPEDQRESFWEEVAHETERLEQETAHMSPDEKEQYLFNLITEETQPEEPRVPEVKETPVKEAPKVKPKPQIPVEKAEEIMSIISQIAKSIESFLTKAAAFPDFDGKVVRWLQKGRVTDWQADSWASFQHELNKFVHTLHRFKEKDPKIGLKHLDALLKQEATIQNLKQLQKKLTDYETAIKISPFEIASMSEQTKNAAINSINALTESLYRTKIPQELQKILEEFDPTAKKLREQEEKATKEALARSKRFEPTVPVRTAGKAPTRRDDFALPSLDDLGLTGRAAPRIGDRGRTRPGEPSDTKKDMNGKGGKGAPGAKPDGKGKKETDKAKAAADKKRKEEKEKKKKKKADEAKKAPTQIQHTEIKTNVDSFRKDVEEAYSTVMGTPEFQSNEELKKYLRPDPPAPPAT